MFPGEEITPPVSKAQVKRLAVMLLMINYLMLNMIVFRVFFQVGTDCLIGETTQLSDKCSIKHSIIGQCCNIGDKVRITNCIIMDNVTIMKEYDEVIYFSPTPI